MGRITQFLTLGLLLILINFQASYATIIPAKFSQIAHAHGVPGEILYAVSLNESGTKLSSKRIKPWPWTLNVKGKSYFYPSRHQACLALQSFTKRYSLKNIDVGIAQINIGWNGHKYFTSHCDGFDVYDNLRVASVLLRKCYNTHRDWVSATGCYHHPKGGTPAERYKQGIRNKLARITKSHSLSGNLKQNIKINSPTANLMKQHDLIKPDLTLYWLEPGQPQLVWIEAAH